MSQLRVMSFNVRYAEPTDGADIWELRRPIVARMLNELRPDIVGCQEPEIEQLRDMEADLPEYRRFGKSRYGNEFEKFSAVFYRHTAVELLDNGAFWISKNPDECASMDWLIHKPYAITWGRFRSLSSGHEFRVFNAQFPYKPEQAEARLFGAKIMSERALRSTGPLFLTGDFNCDANGEVHAEFRKEFRDAWEDAPGRTGPDATFHGFTGTPTHPARLDWILYRGEVEPLTYETVTFNEMGRYVSDHYPVMADFKFS